MNESGATRPAQSARTPKILVIPNEVRNLPPRRGQREGRFLVAPLLGMTSRMLLGMISLMLLGTTGSEAPQNDKSDIQQLKAGQTAHIGVRLVRERGRVFGGKFFFLL